MGSYLRSGDRHVFLWRSGKKDERMVSRRRSLLSKSGEAGKPTALSNSMLWQAKQQATIIACVRAGTSLVEATIAHAARGASPAPRSRNEVLGVKLADLNEEELQSAVVASSGPVCPIASASLQNYGHTAIIEVAHVLDDPFFVPRAKCWAGCGQAPPVLPRAPRQGRDANRRPTEFTPTRGRPHTD